MGSETFTKESKREQVLTQVAAAPDGDVPSGHTLIISKTDNKIYQKTGSTEVEIPTIEAAKDAVIQTLVARITQVDETNGGGTTQVGWAHPVGVSATFDITANNEEGLRWQPGQNIVVDSIICDLAESGQTNVFNSHDFTIRVDVDGTIIEAGSHFVISSAFTRTENTLNSGNGVAVSAAQGISITAVGNSLATGDDVFDILVIIKYHVA